MLASCVRFWQRTAFPGDALVCLLPFWGIFDLVIGNPPFSAQADLEKRPQISTISI